MLPTIERCLSSNTGQNLERNSYFIKVDNRRSVSDVLGQLFGNLNPFCLQQCYVVPMRIEMCVRRPETNTEALVESAEALSLHIDFVDLLDLCAALD